MPNSRGVIINVYIESTNLRSNQKTDPIKKINPKLLSSKPRVFKTRGYDRRAQLLAYAQELRHANAQQQQWPFKNSRRNPKKWRWLFPVQKIRLLISRFDGVIKRKWKYEPIVTEDYSDGEGSCNQERMKSKNTKANGRRIYSHFCKKLRSFMKEISRAWQCKNGGC
ncbi:hypothetical protein DH2020_007816 [Rehmannia glutinosa]|uniref:Uncharacterized protein n=1 Tax=Rehmannia glutinosa TaxID=99300 RepID=A0ABR0TZJ3_REHGL